MRRLVHAIAALLLALPFQVANAQGSHGVILLYHHVSDETPASTSVTPAQFASHLDYLEEYGYRVWPLERLLDAVLRDAEEVPERVVAITFDDAYESVFNEARPRLDERGWPFTVFVNTDAVDAGHSPYMTWDQLSTLAEAGAAIENHSAAHGHMSRPVEGEPRNEWLSRVAGDVSRARARIADEIGRAPTLFAYPYGEDSEALAEIVEEEHHYALAQRSGPVGPLSDPLSVPRFPMATGFASLERLELAVRSRPLPVAAIREIAEEGGGEGAIRAIELTIGMTSDGQGFRIGQLNCFAATGRRLDVAIEGDGPLVVRVDVHGVGAPGRNKINCTAPAEDGSGDFFWHSWQWLVGSPAAPD